MRRKLVLFDIDGTLISTGGIAAGLMAESVSQALGKPIQWTIHDFIGNTDRSILSTLLRRNGATEPMVDDLVEEALEKYLAVLRRRLVNSNDVRVLPGVKKLLKKLKADSGFALGLVTGNVREGARLKLTPGKLMEYFPVGAYGDDALKRDSLPPIAIQRAEKYFRCFFEKEDIWIVGDSLNDVKCAHTNRLRCMAVASGHIKEIEFKTHAPAVIVKDLTGTERIIRLLLS
jgi:phosphoglycolate phosphatase